MSAPNFTWDNASDVLQGISSTPSQAELSPNGFASHDPILGDPASFLGLQFGTDPGVLPHKHAANLNNWLPPHKQSISPTPQQLDFFHYPSVQIMSNQDAWSPLHVARGRPNPAAFAARFAGKINQMSDFDRRCSTGQYSIHTENESQYNGLHSSDSGYSSKSWTTRSIAASYAVDSACSPYLAPHDYEQDEKASLDIGSTHYSEAMDIAEQPESPSLLCHEAIKCDYPNCPWTGKCPSDKRKHEARHKKLFKCDEPNCTRKEGFGTINDLARHKKCVHKKEPERGPKVLYMCFGHNCSRSNKKWPRLDNFRQHLARMHSEEDADDLLKRSQEWYEQCVKPQDMAISFADGFSEDATPSRAQQILEPEDLGPDLDQELRDPIAQTQTAYQPCDLLTLDSLKRLEEEHETHKVDHVPSQTVELPALKALDLEPALQQKACSSSQLVNRKNDAMDDMISDAAVSVINAMTKMINNHQRRRGQVGDDDDTTEQEGELSDRNREILRKILNAASGLLSGDSGSSNSNSQDKADISSDKPGLIQCEICPKLTCLRCEMKKHKKRPERPYGCTFYKCDKTFSSKADWKRHEQSQHFGIQSWQCTLRDPAQGDVLCARMFHQQEAYAQHLRKQHQVGDEEVRTSICRNPLGWNGESQFWCGFCRDIIHLRGDGLAAWNQRFNHIDFEHFKKGERIKDWFLSSSHATKGREHKDKAHDIKEDGHSEPILDDNSDAESICSSRHSSGIPPEDIMAVDADFSHELPLSLTQPGEPARQGSTSQTEQTNHRKRKLRTPHSAGDPYHSAASETAMEKKSRIQTLSRGQPPQHCWKMYVPGVST